MPEKLKKWLENHPLPKNTDVTTDSTKVISSMSAKAVPQKQSDGGVA